jgi:ketosteroid isomerase-like protein
MRTLLAIVALITTTLPVSAQPADSDAAAVRRAVEQFLDDLGNRRLDKLPAQFAPKATMVVVRQRDGQWTSSHPHFAEWLAGLQAQPQGTTFREPLTNVTVQVESGRLAFLRAEFTVVVDGTVRSHGVDYFTLVKDAGTWKVLNASYTSLAGAP